MLHKQRKSSASSTPSRSLMSASQPAGHPANPSLPEHEAEPRGKPLYFHGIWLRWVVMTGVGWASVSHANPCSSVVAVNGDGPPARYRYMTASALLCSAAAAAAFAGKAQGSSLCSGTSRLVSSARNTPFNLRWHAVQRKVARACPIQIIRLLLLPPTPHVPMSPEAISRHRVNLRASSGATRRG